MAAKNQNPTDIATVEFDLANGLHVILQEDHFAPVAAFQVWVKAGSADETAKEAGLAHVIEHMLFKGTEKRGVGEIARDVEDAGGDINAWTSHEETVFHITMPSGEFARGLDILADAVRNPSFDKAELKNELEVIREEIKRGKDSPSRRISEEMFAKAFPGHPYGDPVIGTDESVRSFTRARVAGFHRKWYVPSNMTLVLTGDFDPGVARKMTRKLFGDMQPVPPPKRKSHAVPAQDAPRAVCLSEDVTQAHMALAFHAPHLAHEDLPALDVLAVILGQGDSSRLVHLLRRDRTWVNDIYTYLYAGRKAGLFIVDGDLPAERLADVLPSVGEELQRLHTEAVSEAELEKAKNIVENETVYQMQTMQGKARRLGYLYTHTGDCSFHDRYIEKVRRLSAHDIRQAARAILRPEKANLVALWPKGRKGKPTAAMLAKKLNWTVNRTPVSLFSGVKPDADGIIRATLPSGLRLLYKRNPSVPLVTFQAASLAGLRFEDDRNNGISNMISRTLTLGADELGSQDIAEAVDSMVGNLNGFSGRNTLGLKGSFIGRNFDRAYELFARCLLRPRFDAVELEKEKILVSEEIRAREENPARVAFDLFHRTLYRFHPYRFDMLGDLASVESFEPFELKISHGRFLTADNLAISVVGDVPADRVLAETERLFGELSSIHGVLTPPSPEPTPGEIREAKTVLKRNQTHLVLGFIGLDFLDEDRYALDVLNAILSGQGGRLFVNLRDRKSLAYSVSSYHVEAVDPGYFAAYIGTSPEKRDQAVSGILEEFEQMRQGRFTREEVEHAKRLLIGNHAVSLQTNSAVGSQLLFGELYRIGYNSHLHYAGRIRAVTPAKVKAVARRLLNPDAYTLAEVGP